MAEVGTLREQGNEHFKAGDYQQALTCYAEALENGQMKDSEKAVIHKNRAACHLKLGDNKAAIADATLSLSLAPNDPKALFRRCQAYEALGKAEEAFKDVSQLIKIDPQNKAARPLFAKLNTIVQDKVQNVLSQVKSAINQQQPKVSTFRTLLLPDNAGPHKAKATTQSLRKLGIQVLPHSAYSPNWAPCDFWLFQILKDRLAGRKFDRIQNLTKAVNSELRTIPEEDYQDVFDEADQAETLHREPWRAF
ncbi:protein unc-45 homolog B-like [Elysia marginata]|uniref:Protein unc-45 homolog B-like n=1 Tax=Elysia marginata TaxID=1093978 RepID=A0AAV4GCM5_9GAST|nr:protein unc-45 homolog B-like [Elysia marginata]